jgi:excisionase family DNA binding protein
VVSFYCGQQIRTLGGVEDVVLIPEAARMLGVSRQTLWRHIDRGHLPAKKMGRDYVIKRVDLVAFEAERQKAPGRPRKPTP